ncbi:MAG: hypothetical protein OEY59_04195 [Deltaproteobacteria bacterium]|nr:hypothetical protein [Deltaproteobacteria bacterium]
MNTIGYIQFFDGLAEKQEGVFFMQKVSSRRCEMDISGENLMHRCELKLGQKRFSSQAPSRKEALRKLYRLLNN